MVSTTARNAGGPWFDSRSRHDRLLYANSVCLCNFLYRGILCLLQYLFPMQWSVYKSNIINKINKKSKHK